MKPGIDIEESPDIILNGVRVPPEILGHIFEHVGEARFVGSHSLMTVCKAWNPAFNLAVTGEKFARKGRKATSVLKDCQQNLTNAIFILSDKKTRSHLRISEIFKVAFRHKEFAHAIWKSAQINGSNVTEIIKYLPLLCEHKEVAEEIYRYGEDYSDSLFMYYAAIHHLHLAKKLFKDDIVRQNLTTQELLALGSAHLEITKRILADPHLMLTLTNASSALRKLCVAHSKIATYVLANPVLNATLNGKSLAIIGAAHLDAARAIWESHSLKERLGNEHLMTISLAHAEIAHDLFADLSAAQQSSLITAHIEIARKQLATVRSIEGKDEKRALLRTVMHSHPEIDIEIWSNIYFQETLEVDDLVSLGLSHERIARSVWNNKQLLSQLTDEQQMALGERHLCIAEAIVKEKPALRKKSLALLGIAHEKIANQIWENEALIKELSMDELFELSIHEAIALGIWQSDSLRSTATDEQIREIANNNIMIAREIVADNALCKKLSGEQLCTLAIADIEIAYLVFERYLQGKVDLDIVLIAEKHQAIALKLMKTDELIDALESSQLQALGVAHADVAHLILSDEELRELLDEDELTEIIIAQPAVILSILQDILANQAFNDLPDDAFLNLVKRQCDIFSLPTTKHIVRQMIDDALPENRVHLKGKLYENKLSLNIVRAIFKLSEVNFPLNKPFVADSVIPQRSFFPCILM
ncbi:hypothetical protein [Candidatus Berkiella aquae]|uniref:Uncharacterized protein n=1 Tax=Candidatus Berkiella aquae TaxID=295108 RepID=A0A0Q9YJI1_9GAMM|nr:hypothetical protein [Candidatus Berkiella aquae]MCS5711282.1 hypothetical protein [Candidatus Berkiella aquae]